jgi:hypothetical protein
MRSITIKSTPDREDFNPQLTRPCIWDSMP